MSDTQGAEGVTAKILKDYGQSLGLTIHYNTALTSLIKDGEQVIGLFAAVEGGLCPLQR